MGRKKIEIKPLTDERNRNVTFLKRKAGLMKKAYELSVLCGVSVSILIFAANGKPYEFSSADFDTEVDRYNDYEGAIERRRAAEFEAMALAGEDDDDEEDEKPGSAKKPAVSKSLKGKESFKSRRVPRGVAGDRGVGASSDRRRREHRDRDRDHKPDESFIGALLDDAHPAPQHVHSAPHPHNQYHDVPPHGHHERSPMPPDSPTTASLSYAMGLHQVPPAPSGQQQGTAWNAAAAAMRQGGGPYIPFPNAGAGFVGPAAGAGAAGASGSGGWDSGMFTTYAWLQIQQAHQEQKRHLLEKQQQQLLELTSRSGGHAFIRDMLGVGLGGSGSGEGGGGSSGAPSGQYAQQQEFVWPTAPMDDGSGAATGVSTPPDEDLIWALSGAGSGGPGGAAGGAVPMQPGHAPPPPMPQGNMPSWRVDGRDDRAKRMRL